VASQIIRISQRHTKSKIKTICDGMVIFNHTSILLNSAENISLNTW